MGGGLNELEALLKLGDRLERDPAEVLWAAETLLKVRDRSGALRPLVANVAQRSFEARRGASNIVLKARQMGMTTWVAARFFLRTITRPGTLTLQVAQTQAAAEAIFQVVQRMWWELPEELREGPLRRSRANAWQMIFPELDSEFRVASASDASAGRGLSVQNLHCSEVSRWPGDAAETLAGLRAALAPEGELVLESTPNGSYGAFYEAWLGGVEEAGSEAGLVRHFLPWWMEPAYLGVPVEDDTLREDERRLMERHGLTVEQIGFRRGLEKRSQEFAEDAETCFRATGSCFFDVEAIERRMQELDGPVSSRRGGALQVWFPPQAGKSYVIGVDAAGGGSDGDFAAVQVIERATGLQCAELQQRLRPQELARISVELAREYNGALLAIERNNHGAAVIAYVETVERYARMYAQNGETGWLTTAASKPEMVAVLGSVIESAPERLRSRRLLSECRTFVAGERGRTGAARGEHDDLVMAMAVGLAARSEMVKMD
jgi:hypothetical protein